MVGFLNFYIYEIEFYLCTLNLDGFLDSDGTRRLKLRYDFVCLHFAWVNCFVLCMDIFLMAINIGYGTSPLLLSLGDAPQLNGLRSLHLT